MASTIITKNSSTASATPAVGDLQQGELAVNVTDKKVYTKDSSAAIVKLVGSLGNQEASAVAITGGSIAGITDLAVADGGTGSSTAAGARSNLSAAASGANSDITSLSGLTTALSVAQGGTGVSSSTGSGSVVLSNSPTLVTPALGTPSAAVLTNATGLPLSTGISGLGTGVATFLGTPSSANLLAAVTDETGTGALVFANSPTLVTPALGTPASATLTNATGLPIGTGVSGLGTGVATALAVNVGSAGAPVVNGGVLGTPSSGTLTNATGLPISTGVSGLGTGVATALAVNVGSAGAPVVNGGALGTPSSGTVTNLTGTASININGTVGATTPTTGAFTTLTTSSTVTLNGGTANGLAYLNASKVLTSGSALTFNGTSLTIDGGTAGYLYGPAGELMIGEDASGLYIGNGGGGVPAIPILFGSTATTYQRFNAGGSEQMRLTSTGLGIGTSSPVSPLTINGNDPLITLKNAGTNRWQFGLENTASNRFVFYDNTAAAYRLILDSAGNVGIGTSSPSEKLTVAGKVLLSVSVPQVVLNRGGTTFQSDIKFQTSGTNNWSIGQALGAVGSNLEFYDYGAGVTRMQLDTSGNLGLGVTPNVNDFTSGALGMHIKGSSNYGILKLESSDNKITWFATGSAATYLYVKDANPLIFGTNNTERARIDSSGNLLVGTTSGSNRLTVSSTANDYISRMYNTNGTGADMLYMQSSTDPNNTTYKTIYTLSNASARFFVQSNGGIGNYQANNVNLSDRREKTNFAPADSYLDKICAIPVQTFNYIDQNLEEDGGLTLGVVAQDVQAVAPELVMESNWGTEDEPKVRLSIYQTDLQYALMKCIQEQQAIIESLKARLDAANL